MGSSVGFDLLRPASWQGKRTELCGVGHVEDSRRESDPIKSVDHYGARVISSTDIGYLPPFHSSNSCLSFDFEFASGLRKTPDL